MRSRHQKCLGGGTHYLSASSFNWNSFSGLLQVRPIFSEMYISDLCSMFLQSDIFPIAQLSKLLNEEKEKGVRGGALLGK